MNPKNEGKRIARLLGDRLDHEAGPLLTYVMRAHSMGAEADGDQDIDGYGGAAKEHEHHGACRIRPRLGQLEEDQVGGGVVEDAGERQLSRSSATVFGHRGDSARAGPGLTTCIVMKTSMKTAATSMMAW